MDSCLLRNGNRFFRVSRIETTEVLNETFPSRTVNRNDEEPDTATQKINVHLRFDPNVHYLVLDHFSEEFTVHKDYLWDKLGNSFRVEVQPDTQKRLGRFGSGCLHCNWQSNGKYEHF